VAALVACGEEEKTKQTQRTPAAAQARDAGTRRVRRRADAAPNPSKTAATPASPGGFHLDPGGGREGPSTSRPRTRSAHPLKLTLRSTPPGAVVWIDNQRIGVTPAFHELKSGGKPHRFTFLLEGYAMETYVFVPITDGVVHGTLNKLVKSPHDAGPGKAPAR
jgi:hypothetical protein